MALFSIKLWRNFQLVSTFKIELTDLTNEDKGEAVYYLENTNYIER